MQNRNPLFLRNNEAALLLLTFGVAAGGFLSVTIASHLRRGQNPGPELPAALIPPLLVGIAWLGLHLLLRMKRTTVEPLILPLVSLLLAVGLAVIWRLRGSDGVWQQILRGFIPGVIIMGALAAYPKLIEVIRRRAIWLSLGGLLLLVITAVFGTVDESGARLALRLGPLPPIQTTELVKVAMILFLAWYIEREGEAAEGRAIPLVGSLRLPPLRYFVPGIAFTGAATLALVRMADFGAALILGVLFVTMLYAGFDTRTFATVAAIGLALAVVIGLILWVTWEVPGVIRYRFLAFQNPWSEEMMLQNGQPTGITISEGPGYQIQQALYAIIAGGITGTGLGLGSPGLVPLSFSDFIFAAIVEELGAITGFALLACYAILLFRILRVSILLPEGQVFERLLLAGVAIHLFVQVLIMVGGTLNLMPLTGVTLPFLSLGGVALMVNLGEIGLALALMQRLELPS